MTTRLRLRTPLALLFSAAPWLALRYLSVSLLLGTAWFVVAVTLLAPASALALTWLGLPLLAFALLAVRGLAGVERWRLRGLGAGPATRPYRALTASGVRARLAERLRDPATRRDAILLVALWPGLFLIDTVAVTLWAASAGMITLPIWYRYIPQTFDNGTRAHGVAFGDFPNGPGGGGGWGWLVDDTGSALVAAGVGVVLLVLVGNYLLVATARAHAWIAASLLRPTTDPLAEARRMLNGDPALQAQITRG